MNEHNREGGGVLPFNVLYTRMHVYMAKQRGVAGTLPFNGPYTRMLVYRLTNGEGGNSVYRFPTLALGYFRLALPTLVCVSTQGHG